MRTKRNLSDYRGSWDPPLYSNYHTLARDFHISSNRIENEIQRYKENLVKVYDTKRAPREHGKSKARDHGPPVLLLGSNEELLACTSSLTESDTSSLPTQSAGSSSIWSLSDPPGSPPTIIKVSTPRQPLQPTTLPYAQLCFDPEKKILVTLMEVNLMGNGRRSKRLRILDPNTLMDGRIHAPAELTTTSSASGTETTASSRTNGHSEEKEEPRFLFGTEDVWFEETDLDLYLLHDCGDPWKAESRGGCTDTLKKMLIASRSILIFRKDQSWESPRESYSGIGYTMLDNDI